MYDFGLFPYNLKRLHTLMHVADINIEFSPPNTHIDEKIYVVPALSVGDEIDLLHLVKYPSRLGEAGYSRLSRVTRGLEKSE